MNKLTKNTLKWIASLFMVAALGYAGSLDYQAAVISSMSQELYHKILLDLGGTASEKDICDTYIKDKIKYDSLGM